MENGEATPMSSKRMHQMKKEDELFVARTTASEIIAGRLILGYRIHSDLCTECDMPKMKSPDGEVACVVCPTVQDAIEEEEALQCELEEASASLISNEENQTHDGLPIAESAGYLRQDPSGDLFGGNAVSANTAYPNSGTSVLKKLLEDSNVCRDVATGFIHSRIREGYSLSARSPCLDCGMPLVELRGEASCVVCPEFPGAKSGM